MICGYKSSPLTSKG